MKTKTPNIKGLNKNELVNLKRLVVLDISNWEQNKYKKSKKDFEYNVLYFSDYLKNINKELRKQL